MEFGKPYAYRGMMCASGNCQWCEKPYFAGTAISVMVFCSKFPGETIVSHYRSNQGFVEC
jgi:hypothetical protein